MRLMLTGPRSGCGKTTATLSLMAALSARGLSVAPFKSGPDYLDAAQHRAACGHVSHNLDEFLMNGRDIRTLLAMGEASCDVALIEGAMGYYDGIGGESSCSAWSLARLTETPAVLVVDATGGAANCAATVLGFLHYAEESRIAGVLVNRAATARQYKIIRDAIDSHTGIPCVGYLPKDAAFSLNRRGMSLSPAEDAQQLAERVSRAAAYARDTLDFDTLLSIAQSAKKIEREPFPQPKNLTGLRMGYARDEAFSFYYEANLDTLRRAGVELVPFSTLLDAELPKKLDALYFGGGVPEVYARQISQNRTMRQSVLDALESGVHCYAECGGTIYLAQSVSGQPMTGFLPLKCRMTEKLQRFGYVHVTDRRTGRRFPGYEFHHTLAEPAEGPLPCVFDVERGSDSSLNWTCGYTKKNTLASYPHLHLLSHPDLIETLWKL